MGIGNWGEKTPTKLDPNLCDTAQAENVHYGLNKTSNYGIYHSEKAIMHMSFPEEIRTLTHENYKKVGWCNEIILQSCHTGLF